MLSIYLAYEEKLLIRENLLEDGIDSKQHATSLSFLPYLSEFFFSYLKTVRVFGISENERANKKRKENKWPKPNHLTLQN